MLRTCAVAVLLACSAAQSLAQDATLELPTLDLPALLQRLADATWLHRPPGATERSVQWSSYDRSSDQGPGNQDAWYANNDRGQYLRVVAKAGGAEYVMCETDGPGVIARIWSANPSGTLHFDIDGARVWSVDMAQLCSGKVAPIAEPLAGMHAKGGNCYLPIPFGKRVVVSATAADLYYHVNVWFPPQGTTVVSFAPAMLTEHKGAIDSTVFELGGEPVGSAIRHVAPSEAWPPPLGIAAPVRKVEPGHVVEWLTVRFDRPRDGVDLGELLRAAELVVRCGDEETVRVPLLDFFGCGPDVRPHAGRFLASAPGCFTCRWPMPMPRGGEVRIEGPVGQPPFHLDVVTSKSAQADDLLFRASFRLEQAFPSRPFRDFTVLDARGGPGRFVGTALLVKNPHRGWWGEGDEKFYVDGESFPSTFGTGTEDYFGYAWCCTDPFRSAFHSQPQCDGPGNYGFTAVHRVHALDSVPFQRSFRFDLEVWHWVPKLAIDYASVAWWYGAAGAQSGLPPLPAAGERRLDRLPPPPVLKVEGALEAEQLRVASRTGGKHEVQSMWFVAGAFSADAQLWWMDGKPGDTLSLAVPVAKAGRYRLVAAFAKAPDYGVFQVRIGDRDLGAPLDLYSAEVMASGPLELGQVDLAAGEAMLAFRVVGHHDRAEPRHMLGFDYLRLEKVE